MDKLPIPIINQIFLHLHQKEKLQCMLVCREWSNIIEMYTLYHTVYLTKPNGFQQLLKVFQQNSSRGLQVRHMSIRLIDEDLDPNQVITFLPNLRFVDLSMVHSSNKPIVEKEPQILQELCIEYLLEHTGFYFTYELLSTSLCSRLKSLYVSSSRLSDSGTALIKLLLNAPVLSNIHMIGFRLSFSDVELLHLNAPALSFLKLSVSGMKGGLFPTTIEPMARVFEFSLMGLDLSIQDIADWCRYINKKYSNLSKFEFEYTGSSRYSPEDLERLSAEVLAPFFQHLGQQFNSLSFQFRGAKLNYFKIFEKSKFMLQNFSTYMLSYSSVLPDLSLLGRLKHIQKLSIIFHKLTDLDWLRDLESIKDLDLACGWIRSSVNGVAIVKHSFLLNQIVEICGKSLESLKISLNPIAIKPGNIQAPLLKHLHLHNVSLPKHFDLFITRTFPGLESLEFQDCNLNEPRFTIPNHHLVSLKISERRRVKTILLETNSDQRLYAALKGSSAYSDTEGLMGISYQHIYPATYSIPFHPILHYPDLTFSCASVRSFDFKRV